jgi:phosphopantothenoylcysteine decarboxylase / phosphopantothenate---cysteine ligase
MTVDMRGRRVVVTAGGTREAIDPVRFIGNRSSGRQGYALAATAVARGAEVVLISANVSLAAPAGVRLILLTNAAEMREAVATEAPGADALVMAAAVADWRPATVADEKMKKTADRASSSIELVETVDVLAETVAVRAAGEKGARVIVGFAAETGDDTGSVLDHGRAKIARKGADLLVVNDVGPGGAFESLTNAVVILGSDGSETVIEPAPKTVIADRVWDLVVARWDR